MRILFIILITSIFIAGCIEEKEDRSPKVMLAKMEQDYLRQIEDLGITGLYNETKWRLYCNHCDVPVKNCAGKEMKGVTFGMLDLQVFYVNFENNRGELAYTFIYNKQSQCTLENVAGNKIHGIGFERNGKTPLYFISAGETAKVSVGCDTMPDLSDCPTRMIDPNQPVVKKYLLANRSKLNPWFHMEAIKRGVLED